MKRSTRFATFAAVGAMFLPGSGAALAREAAPLDFARQLNDAFTQVAGAVSPAVVVIDVTLSPSAASEDDEDNSPSGGSESDAAPPDRYHFQGHSLRKPAQPRRQQAEGSGIIVTPDGYILTNDHVVEGAEKITVLFKDGRQFTGEIKGTDPVSDIAVIKIKANGLTPAKLGDSDATRVGEFVLAIGAPFELSYSVTVGHVSAKSRSFEGSTTQNYEDQDFLQTDAAINPGNSGGPLVNLYGEVIAINTMIEGMNTGIGFAIPINLAKGVMKHLIEEGKYTRSWLGISIRDLQEERDYQGLARPLAPDARQGVVVDEIRPDGPAAKSSLRAGDVIIGIDSRTVDNSRDLKNAIAARTPGRPVALAVVRGPQHLTVTVTPELLPEDKETAASSQPGPGEIQSVPLGITVQGLTRELAAQFGVEQNKGVIITAVEQDSVADDHELKPGDIITEIDRKTISSPRQFREALKSANLKRGMMVIVLSDGGSRFVVLRDDSQ